MKDLNDYLDEVQIKISYWFKNIALLFQAFTRSSYSAQYGGENNEVLEFIGDRVLDFYVVRVIADRFGFTKSQLENYDANKDLNEFCISAHKNESDFTDLKKEIVSNKTLAKRIDELGFADYLFLGDSDIDNHVELQTKVKADLFEAILGAIAIDSNWDPDKLQNSVEFMLQIEDFLSDVNADEYNSQIDITLENAINILKELGEHGICSIPEYIFSNEPIIDENGQQWWNCTCIVRSWAIEETVHAKNKKLAKKYASYRVLCDYYGLEDEYDDEEEDDE